MAFAVFLKRVGSPARWQSTTATDWHPRMTSDQSAPAMALLEGQIKNPSTPGPWEKFDVDDADTYHAILEIKHGAARRALEEVATLKRSSYSTAQTKARAVLGAINVRSSFTASEIVELQEAGFLD